MPIREVHSGPDRDDFEDLSDAVADIEAHGGQVTQIVDFRAVPVSKWLVIHTKLTRTGKQESR